MHPLWCTLYLRHGCMIEVLLYGELQQQIDCSWQQIVQRVNPKLVVWISSYVPGKFDVSNTQVQRQNLNLQRSTGLNRTGLHRQSQFAMSQLMTCCLLQYTLRQTPSTQWSEIHEGSQSHLQRVLRASGGGQLRDSCCIVDTPGRVPIVRVLCQSTAAVQGTHCRI